MSEVDYSKHISSEVSSKGISEVKGTQEELLNIMARSLLELSQQAKLSFNITVSSYHVWFSFSTASTTRTKIDILKELSIPATEMYIVSSGGGFDIEINDESNKIRASDGLRVYNEIISRVYITGYNNAGTGQIRFGVSK